MDPDDIIEPPRKQFARVSGVLDERGRRVWAAAAALGFGGQLLVASVTGVVRTTLYREPVRHAADRSGPPGPLQRKVGGGRTRLIEQEPALLVALVEPTTRGAPEHPLRWTCLNTRPLATALDQSKATGLAVRRWQSWWTHEATAGTVTRQRGKGASHADRVASCRSLHRRVGAFQRCGQPVVAVDTKQKELVGACNNAGRAWRPRGDPARFGWMLLWTRRWGQVNPYGVYDTAANVGWVSGGVDHGTAELAVATWRRWWLNRGRLRSPAAMDLLVTADGGGRNGSRVRLWKVALQRLATDHGQPYPAGDEHVEYD